MDEAFLHYIWKFQKFNSSELRNTQDEEVKVYASGVHNHDSGPDFSEARLKIGKIEWVGDIEIHVHSSDWIHHDHLKDAAYDRVILHVVWTHDRDIQRTDGTVIPVLEIQKLVAPSLVIDYKNYLAQNEEVLCTSMISRINELTWNSNLDSMLLRRLEHKSVRILELAKSLNFEWEETAYITLARNFGFSINGEAFERMAKLTSLKFLIKHQNQPKQIFSILFGQAGFLANPVDAYQVELGNEYRFLKSKYQLDELDRSEWKTGKMRPSNFPTVRLAQFASLLSVHQKLFSLFQVISSVRQLKRTFQLKIPDYWQEHYDFKKKLHRGSNQLGSGSLENLIINSVVPLLSAYAIHTQDDQKMEKAVNFLQQLPAESNRYTKKFESMGKPATSAFDSQAQITLFRDFCSRKNCLNCTVGAAIFK